MCIHICTHVQCTHPWDLFRGWGAQGFHTSRSTCKFSFPSLEAHTEIILDYEKLHAMANLEFSTLYLTCCVWNINHTQYTVYCSGHFDKAATSLLLPLVQVLHVSDTKSTCIHLYIWISHLNTHVMYMYSVHVYYSHCLFCCADQWVTVINRFSWNSNKFYFRFC